jgi:acyl-CoA-binding protein
MKKSIPILLLCLFATQLHSTVEQRKKKKPEEPPKVQTPPPSKTVKISDKIKSCKEIPGLFRLYQDSSTGSLMMIVNKEQLNKEYIYFSYVENGNNSTGHVKGTFRDNKVFTIQKYFDDLEFVALNESFYFDPNNPLSKAADANISKAVMSSEKIIAKDEAKGEYLISADQLFLTEALHQIKTMPRSPQQMMAFNLGALNKSKTRYEKIKNYPENTDIVVRYAYDDPGSRGANSNAITDGRYVEILLQHSIIEMPKNDFKPRYDDPRIGYFSTEVNDMTTKSAVNYKDLIHRWNLVKKDPNAAISEPVKPITWWIENTTPLEFRPIIKKAILQWNIAFEKAGFKNAVQIFEQPDTAAWDAGDIRYNVLRWTSSPEPRFGGYGPSFVNPRTGEILGADIMLEWIFVTNRLKSRDVFERSGFESLLNQAMEESMDHASCEMSEHLHIQNLLGTQYLSSINASETEVDSFIEQSIYYLILHEVGHTMGLSHNMKASQLHNPDDLYDLEKTMNEGLTGSVMDYPAVNFSNRKGKKCQYYTMRPGPYDMWAIEFGYYQEYDEQKSEEKRKKLLMRSTEPQLSFGNDADDMRAPGKAIDPRVMIGDMSNDAVGYAIERINFIRGIQNNLLKNYGNDDRSYQDLRNKFNVLVTEWGTQAGIISRYIGGVYVDRSYSNQKSSVKPFTAVPLSEQKRAMKSLSDLVFAPNAFNISEDLAASLQRQRRGFGFFSAGEDPRLHATLLSVQQSVLIHILHPNTLERINDSKAYGNKYEIGDVFKDLSNAIFQADMTGDINSYRQNLQIFYVNFLGFIYESSLYDYISQSKAYNQLLSLQRQIQASLPSSTGNAKEHKIFILSSIKNTLEQKK